MRIENIENSKSCFTLSDMGEAVPFVFYKGYEVFMRGWTDDKRGYVINLSNGGITPIRLNGGFAPDEPVIPIKAKVVIEE